MESLFFSFFLTVGLHRNLFIIFFIFIYFPSIFENMKIASQTSLGIYTLFSMQCELIVSHPGKTRDLLHDNISGTAE
jgi:hypothetical protein